MTDLPQFAIPFNMSVGQMIEDCVEDSTRWFPGKAQALPNLVLCMCGEAGEVANLVKKIVRGDMTVEQAKDPIWMERLGKDTLPEEIIDVLIYLCNLMGAKEFVDVDWKTIWDEKRNFNEGRFGDHRSESQRYIEEDLNA